MSDQLVTVTGTYWAADNVADRGTVALYPVAVAGMSAQTRRLVTQRAVAADLDAGDYGDRGSSLLHAILAPEDSGSE